MAGLDPTRSSDEIDDRVKPICINPSRAATQNEISSADQAANSLAALTIDLPDPELLPSSQSHGSTASLVSFSKLPRELRLKIWRMAMPETRLVNIGPLFPTPAGRLYICECRTEASQAQIGEEDEHIPVTSAICQESRNETLRFFHIDARHHYAICPTIDTFWFSFDCIKYLELVNNTREPSHQISTDDQDRDQALLDSVEELEVHGFEFLIQPDDARIYKFVDFAGEGVELDVLLSLRSLKRICFTWSSRYTSLFVDDAGRMHTDDVDLVCTEDIIKRFFESNKCLFSSGQAPRIMFRLHQAPSKKNPFGDTYSTIPS